MEEILKSSCKKAVEEQVHTMAEREGFEVGEVEVKLSQNNDDMEVTSIIITVADNGDASGRDEEDDGDETLESGIEIEDIVIDKTAAAEGAESVPVSEAFGNAGRRQLTGKRARRLKNTLKDYYLLQEEAVQIWKY